MATRAKVSAGLMMYRRKDSGVEVLLAHPGGPLFARKDAGAWTIPKGEPNAGEDLEDCARREFAEETGIERDAGELVSLGSVQQKGGKVVHAWAFEGDCDVTQLHCNTFELEWPPKSGRKLAFPEVDRFQFFDAPSAKEKLNPAQVEFVERLAQFLG
jgi:predicted NUDIX family NTP pyrophosphohydrolase